MSAGVPSKGRKPAIKRPKVGPVVESEEQATVEAYNEEVKRTRIDERLELLERFSKSPEGQLILELLDEEIEATRADIDAILVKDMKATFLMTGEKNRVEHVESMSRKYIIILGVHEALQNFKRRITSSPVG